MGEAVKTKISKVFVDELRANASQYYFYPKNINKLFDGIDKKTIKVDRDLAEIVIVLKGSIESLLETLSLPYMLIASSASNLLFQRLHGANSIRSLMLTSEDIPRGADLESYRRKIAKQKTNKAITNFIKSNTFKVSVFTALISATNERHVKIGLADLLRQSTMALWSIFESFCRGVFTYRLKLNPYVSIELCRDSDTKKKFENVKLSFEKLSQYDFNIKTKLASIMLEGQDLSDISTIRAVFKVIFDDNNNVRSALNDERLWLLFQQRNVIVHNGGFVDEKYISKTGSRLKNGDVLPITPGELDDFLKAIMSVAEEIICVLSAEQPHVPD